MTTRIAQLTDLHLYRDPDGRLAGVPTQATFRDVLDHLRACDDPPDYLVLTGDLAQDEAPETYALLREMLAPWEGRYRLVPGNHDDRGAIRETFAELFADGDGPLGFSVRLDGWRLVGLDTLVPGEVGGRLSAGQLEWLADELAGDTGAPALIFLHHPPVTTDMPWLDPFCLGEPHRLLDLAKSHPHVRAIACGHVHHAYDARVGELAVYTAPSTAVQFCQEEKKVMADKPPGYRLFTLNGAELASEPVFLAEMSYPVEPRID